MQKTLRQTYLGANEIRYADPDNFANTVRLTQTTQPKKAGSRNVYNSASRLSAVRNIKLPALPNCDKCVVDQERISITVNFSGSTDSKEEVLLLIADTKVWLDTIGSDLTSGFLPVGKDLTITVPDTP